MINDIKQTYFGEYNRLYFLWGESGLGAVQDRRHRKPKVLFQEQPVKDLRNPPRESYQLAMESPSFMQSESSTIEVAGKSYKSVGNGRCYRPMGFGRGLDYHEVLTDSSCLTVLLVVDLPPDVAYSVRLNPTRYSDTRFELENDMSVEVLSDIEWVFDNGLLRFETTRGGKIAFLIASEPTPSRIAKTVILAAKGAEPTAVIARAAFGRDFVPCFVMDERDHATLFRNISQIRYDTLILCGIDAATLGLPNGTRTVELDLNDVTSSRCVPNGRGFGENFVLIPNVDEAFGPGLLLAVKHNASLELHNREERVIYLRTEQGEIQWTLDRLVGSYLATDEESESTTEVVIIENSLRDLLVCQGVGYASMKGCKVAFIPRIASSADPSIAPAATDPSSNCRALEELCERSVPEGVRNPDSQTITVFTDSVPLHLAPVDNASDDLWVDRYSVAHLPGSIGSILIPRFMGPEPFVAPDVPFGVVFDTLSEFAKTESSSFEFRLSDALSHPILLRGKEATGEVLREVVQRLDTDLIVLATHGERDYIEDGTGRPIDRRYVASWAMRGAPVVFNNSCSSWHTTGSAFIQAGARALISTLWPVDNASAQHLAATLAQNLLDDAQEDLASLLAKTLQQPTSIFMVDHATRKSFVYVGIPRTGLVSSRPISEAETVSLLSRTLESVIRVVLEVAEEHSPGAGILMHNVMLRSIGQRLSSLIVEGEMPYHLSGQFSPYTVLETDLVISLVSFRIGLLLAPKLPRESRRSLFDQMEKQLVRALNMLNAWDDRHDKHLGRTPEDMEELSVAFRGMPVGALGEAGWYHHAAKMTLHEILPFAAELAAIGEDTASLQWFRQAGKLVTTRDDLDVEGWPSDTALIARIKAGFPMPVQMISVDGGGATESTLDLLQHINKSDLANRFGVVLLRLGEHERASHFFQLACELAEPSSSHRDNAESNLNRALYERGVAPSFSKYLSILYSQVESGDYSNAVTTAANIIRAATLHGQEIEETVISMALKTSKLGQSDKERAVLECSILAPLSTYRASQQRNDEARSIHARILAQINHLRESGTLEDRLRELIAWYGKNEQHSNAIELACVNADALEAAGLSEAAAITLMFAAETAAAAARYTFTAGNRWLKLYIDLTRRVGELVRANPGLRENRPELFAKTPNNVSSVLDFASRSGAIIVAYDTYRCLITWEPEKRDRDWDLLGNALHAVNRRSVSDMAKAGKLLRKASVVVTAGLSVRTSVTTSRASSSHEGEPQVAFIYVPLTAWRDAQTFDDETAMVAGHAVFGLKPGEERTIIGSASHQLRTDGRGKYLLDEVWGSKIYSYDFSISFEGGQIPLAIEFKLLNGEQPDTSISMVGDRSLAVNICGQLDASGFPQPWLGRLQIFFTASDELFEVISRALSAKSLPMDQYSSFLQNLYFLAQVLRLKRE